MTIPGTNSSNTPHSTRFRIGCRRPSQLLNGPTTLTRLAFGAQTRKATPSTPSIGPEMGAQLLVNAEMIALADQMDVHLAEQRRKAIGIVDHALFAAVMQPEAVAERYLLRQLQSKQPSACTLDISPALLPDARSMTNACVASGWKLRITTPDLSPRCNACRAR